MFFSVYAPERTSDTTSHEEKPEKSQLNQRSYEKTHALVSCQSGCPLSIEKDQMKGQIDNSVLRVFFVRRRRNLGKVSLARTIKNCAAVALATDKYAVNV